VRIIGGEFRSRRLKSLPGWATRPTPDRLRETLFDILGGQIENTVFLDAYAGTGAVGIEALSRGAARAVFIERSRNATRVLRENLSSLGLEGRALVVPRTVTSSIAHHQADIVFMDPPYDREAEYADALNVLAGQRLKLVVVQHSVRFMLAGSYGRLQRTRILKQGDNALSFYAVG